MAEQWAWESMVMPPASLKRIQDLEDHPTFRRGAVPKPVTRSVAADPRGIELIGLLGRVPAGSATLAFRGAVPRQHERGDLRTYRATLSFGGLLPIRQNVEVDVAHYGGNLASVTVRSADRLSRRVSEERYAEAVGSALGSLERLLPWQGIVADTAARLFAAASGVPAAAEVGEDDDEQAA